MTQLIGLKRGIARLDEYSLQWEGLFEKEKETLQSLLGDLKVDVYHIGSTSIPGMIAKPIIDIAVVIDDLDELNEYIKDLEEAGFIYRADHDTWEKRLFIKGGEDYRTHHIHFYRRDSSQLKHVLTFRDYLYYNQEPAEFYTKFKRLLAARYPSDRLTYTEIKGEFIDRILAIANFERERGISIRRVKDSDFHGWLRMRYKLWAECPIEEHIKEINQWLSSPETPVYIAECKQHGLVGFVETSIHNTVRSSIGYIEGWYVEETHRRIGIGKTLLIMAETWALSMGFSEMGSDVKVENYRSIAAHKRLDYNEIDRDETEVKFLKALTSRNVSIL